MMVNLITHVRTNQNHFRNFLLQTILQYCTVLYMLHSYKHFCTLIPANLLQKLRCGPYTSQHVVTVRWHAISYDTQDRQMRSLGPTKLSKAGRPVCCLVCMQQTVL